MIEKSYDGYKLYIYKDKLELSSNVSNFIENQIIQTLKIKDRFQFCVSGGSTPKSVYQLPVSYTHLTLPTICSV